jgi:hypothetical protein
MSIAAEPVRNAPIALWRIAQAFITTLFNVFGAPEEIAAQDTLTPKSHRLLCDWLRVGEALLRRLLLIEAAHCAKPNVRPPLRPQRARIRKVVAFDAEHPEEWRVSFRCVLDRRRPRRRNAGAPRKAAKRFHSAWPLAERAEALLRAYNDPGPYARRLARRLHAAPHRARALIACPANAPTLIDDAQLAQTEAPAHAALRRFDSG